MDVLVAVHYKEYGKATNTAKLLPHLLTAAGCGAAGEGAAGQAAAVAGGSSLCVYPVEPLQEQLRAEPQSGASTLAKIVGAPRSEEVAQAARKVSTTTCERALFSRAAVLTLVAPCQMILGMLVRIAKQFSNAELKALANYLASVEGDLQVVPQSRFR